MTVTPPNDTTPPVVQRRRWRRWGAAGFGGLLLLTTVAAAWVHSLGPVPVLSSQDVSTIVVDKDNRLLRPFAMPDGRWRLPVHALADVDPAYLKMLLAYEDRRFRTHIGVDPLAMIRASMQWIVHGRIRSGGSTITMQVARLLEPRQERSVSAKLRQMVRAIQLERRHSKDEILLMYLALAPYGGNLEGIRAASIAYFGKEPKRLSLSEAALLVALPQSPETRRMDRHPERARIARDRVLHRMVKDGHADPADLAQALAAKVPVVRLPFPMLAPHSAEAALRDLPGHRIIRLSLDAGLQRALEGLAADRAQAIGPDVSVAILAVDHATGEVRAHVGSSDYFSTVRAGQVDMVRAIRSPGSTLKPFIYGLSFEDGIAHPETLIDDRRTRFGAYAPENFDMSYQGTVSVRKALQLSLNVPTIALLDRVGSHRLSARLRQAGANLVLPKDEVPGLAMGLGGVGISLADLVQLYSGLANGGVTRPLRERLTGIQPGGEGMRLMDPVAAWHVGNVLLGTPPAENAAPNRIAFKTGTSYGYRDAWSVGFDGRMTIGVWVGRADGAPVPGLIGRSAAAPILFDAFARTGQLIVPLPKAPQGTLHATNARLPLPLRRFRSEGEVFSVSVSARPRFQFPLDGSRLEVASRQNGGDDNLPVRIAGGKLPITLMVNGVAVGEADSRRQRLISSPGPGFVRLTVVDASGAADTVVVRIQ